MSTQKISMKKRTVTAEWKRLEHCRTRKRDWKNWGPYVSDRAWGTVREDYSGDGNAWEFFPHSHAIKRAYRWNEDGIGIYNIYWVYMVSEFKVIKSVKTSVIQMIIYIYIYIYITVLV